MPRAPSPLTYEPLTEQHAVELHAELHDERLYRFIPERPPKSLAALQREYAEFSAGAPTGSGEVWLNWAVREQASGLCVGTVQATRFADGMLWVGYKVVPAAWQRGVATSALGWLVQELLSTFNGQPIHAAVDTRNHPSIRVLEKCRFQLLRQEPAELHGEKTEDFIYRFTGPRSAA
jgi:[ribosomal protein S5]-alanine N-acetyltransferase